MIGIVTTLQQRADLKARQGAAMVHTDSLRIVSLETGEDVPADGQTMGEIWIRGNTIMKGYLKDKDATDDTLSKAGFVLVT